MRGQRRAATARRAPNLRQRDAQEHARRNVSSACTPRVNGIGLGASRLTRPPRLCAHSKTSAGLRWDEEVDGSFAILDLKALLSESCDIETEHQRLVYKGRVLQDALTLDSSGARRPLLTAAPQPCTLAVCPLLTPPVC